MNLDSIHVNSGIGNRDLELGISFKLDGEERECTRPL